MLSVARAVSTLFEIYEFLIIVWCLLSWIPRKPGGWIDDIASVVNSLVAPYMNIFRRFVPSLGGLDFSPVVGIVVLSVLQNFVVRALVSL